MRQAIHIFKKDVRYLWREIVLLLLLAVLFALGYGRGRSMYFIPGEVLLLAAAVFAIVRLVHAEVIPGDRQFWVTRPYRWTSLLGAKLLFVVALVSVPMLFAQAYIALDAGFSLPAILPGLLWSQLLFLLVVLLPVAALAALTAGLAPFVTVVFALLLTVSGAAQWRLPHARFWPALIPQASWVRSTVGTVLLAGIAAAVLYLQYRTRRTRRSRVVAAASLAVALVVFSNVPARWGYASLPGSPPPDASYRIAVEPVARVNRFGPLVQLNFPVEVASVPDGVDVRADYLDVVFTRPAGDRWKPGFAHAEKVYVGPGAFEAVVSVPNGVFERERRRPLTMRGSLYLTTFGDTRTAKLPLQSQPADTVDGLRCFMSEFENRWSNFICYSAFRWPARLVYAQGTGKTLWPVSQTVSYSPFPAEMNFNPIEYHWASVPPSTGGITVITRRPLQHFRRDFEVRDFRLPEP